MAFVRLAFFPDATAEHFEALAGRMGGDVSPAGRLVFAAGAVAGGWQVVQVWHDRALLEEFNREHFLPALASLGPHAFPAPPRITDFSTSTLAVTP